MGKPFTKGKKRGNDKRKTGEDLAGYSATPVGWHSSGMEQYCCIFLTLLSWIWGDVVLTLYVLQILEITRKRFLDFPSCIINDDPFEVSVRNSKFTSEFLRTSWTSSSPFDTFKPTLQIRVLPKTSNV